MIMEVAMGDTAKPAGIYAPSITAFNEDESLNQQSTRAFIRFLLHSSVHGLAPLGSAGEFVALTENERMRAMEWILDGTRSTGRFLFTRAPGSTRREPRSI
jgi:dihydrodipicolinate synthase/N-acetylneuraminate lyase